MPSTVTLPSHDEMVANIRDVYRAATYDQRDAGAAWYADSARISVALAHTYLVTREQAAGVIAAVSPLNSWGANVNLAGRIIANHVNGTPQTDGYLSVGLAKANAILDGADPLDVLRSNKVRAFYASIVSAGRTSEVCIDRHAYSIAVGERTVNVPSITDKRFRAIGDAYREAARTFGIDAAILQAITWVAWRQRFWAVGAFDGK